MRHTLAAAAALLLTVAAQAQAPRVYTDADYAQAEKFMPYNVNSLVLHTVESPQWLADGRFWYRDQGASATQYLLVDPAHQTKTPAFDPAKLAPALTALNPGGRPLDAARLPIEHFTLADADKTLNVTLRGGQTAACDLTAYTCKPLGTPAPAGTDAAAVRERLANQVVSPDGRQAAFIRDWNLYLRDTATGREVQITRDGIPNFGYATDNAGWQHSDKPVLLWSPDSRRIATFQQDQRKTGELYLTNVTNTHPTLTTLKYPLVGDKDVTMIERVVIDLGKDDKDKPEKAKVVRLKMPPDQHRSTLCDDVHCRGGSGWDDVQWSPDSRSLAFVSTSRDHKQEWMRIANPGNGDVRDVMGETVKDFFDSGIDKVNWHYLPASDELLWWSERSGWGHLYLYDLKTGQLKHAVTYGDWNVAQVLSVDEKARQIYFLGYGKELSNDPYYAMFYRVSFDGTAEPELLTPDRANHNITISPDNRLFVDAYSTPIAPQITVVRDVTGKEIMPVTHQDISRLKATGWIPPVQIEVKARDGETDLYGFLFRPTSFTTDGHYPIINHVYPGPQVGSCGPRNFQAAHGDDQSLAELGFIVVCIDGMGTPFRSKAFHAFYATDLGDDTIPDQVTGMQQLAERYPWVDLPRSGIYGHSGGGNATVSAMFHFPDFFKIGIAESGNHDNRLYEDDWAEKWNGLLVTNPDGSTNYDSQANQQYAKNLKGHLLLAHGTVDDNVPPANTLLVVDALIKANKDFDLLMIPNVRHGYAEAGQYMTRRRWDYFVRYLAGGTPPHEYLMKPYAQTLRTLGTGPADEDTDGTEP